MKLIVGFLSLAFVTDLLCLYLAFQNMNNLLVFHIFTLLSYVVLMTAFSIWAGRRRSRRIMQLSIPLFTVWWLVAKLTIEKLSRFDTLTLPLAAMLLVAASVYTLYHLSKSDVLLVHRDPRFWVSAAVMIYYSTGLATYAVANAILSDESIMVSAWHIRWVLSIVSNLCFGGGLMCHRVE